jgi:hypothetical protein
MAASPVRSAAILRVMALLPHIVVAWERAGAAVQNPTDVLATYVAAQARIELATP